MQESILLIASVTSSEVAEVGDPKNVRILPSISGRFVRAHSLSPIPPKRIGIRHAKPRAQKRMSFCESPGTYWSFFAILRKRLSWRNSRFRAD
jgi:hypothetical protein